MPVVQPPPDQARRGPPVGQAAQHLRIDVEPADPLRNREGLAVRFQPSVSAADRICGGGAHLRERLAIAKLVAAIPNGKPQRLHQRLHQGVGR